MDLDKLVEAVTKVIMEKLQGESSCDMAPKVATFGNVPMGILTQDCQCKPGSQPADMEGCDFILMTAQAYREIHGMEAKPERSAAVSSCEGRSIDLRGKRLIHERDLRDHNAGRGDVLNVDKNVIITALAHDYAKSIGSKFCKEA